MTFFIFQMTGRWIKYILDTSDWRADLAEVNDFNASNKYGLSHFVQRLVRAKSAFRRKKLNLQIKHTITSPRDGYPTNKALPSTTFPQINGFLFATEVFIIAYESLERRKIA